MSHAISASDITGLILSGGRGSRMGDVDKGLHLFKGKPMALHAMERFAPQVGCLMINANRNEDAYRALGVPIIGDDVGGFAGPLAGIHAGLSHCKTPYLAVAPCDSPFLPLDLIQRLAVPLIEKNADLAVAATTENGTLRWQSVFCLLKVSVLPSLTRYLDAGERKVEFWQKSQKFVSVAFEDSDAFRNLNTPEDWLGAEHD